MPKRIPAPRRLRHTAATLTCVAAVILAPAAMAQTYPAKALRIIVPFAAGGPTDILARAMGQKLTESWGQPVVVENRGGASGNIGAEAVAKAAPDGYTLLFASAGILSINPSLYSRLPFDVQRDFSPITLAASITNVLVVHPSLPVKSVKELIRFAAARPGQLTYASAGNGSASHLAMELFKEMAHVEIAHVPYKGATPGVTDLLGGHVHIMLIGLPAALPQVRVHKLTALGVSSLRRSPIAPDLPTIAESGLPGFDVVNWLGVLAPAGTPRTVVAKLDGEISKILRQSDTRQRLIEQGFDPIGSTPDEFAAYMKAETAKWAGVVKRAGARAD